MLASPRHDADHPDRQFECQVMLEPASRRIAEEAVAAGWEEDEVAFAMLAIDASRVKTLLASMAARNAATHALGIIVGAGARIIRR